MIWPHKWCKLKAVPAISILTINPLQTTTTLAIPLLWFGVEVSVLNNVWPSGAANKKATGLITTSGFFAYLPTLVPKRGLEPPPGHLRKGMSVSRTYDKNYEQRRNNRRGQWPP